MAELRASRTLVKSPPELWAECSDAAALARHLGQFGEVRITRLEPESTVAWEGERARGTVQLEPAGWGTKVTLTAVAEGGPAPAPPGETAQAPPLPAETPSPAETASPPATASPARPRRFPRLFPRLRWRGPAPDPPPAPDPSPASDPSPALDPSPAPDPSSPLDPSPAPDPSPALDPSPPPDPSSPLDPSPAPDAEGALTGALDSLGQAHHRPFSRA